MIVDRCRMCLGGVDKVFSLTPTPIANGFTKQPEPYAVRFPLDLTRCRGCGHIQLGYAVPGSVLFKDYKYRTPEAERKRLAEQAIHLSVKYKHALGIDKVKVVEIGGNNGIFTDELNKVGFWSVCIDPAAQESGLPKWFTSKTALTLRDLFGRVKLIVANNVFSHVDDLRNVMLGIDRLLDDDGAVVFEVQYLPDLVAGGRFDMIYHEHKDYHTLKPWGRLLRKYGFGITEVEYLDVHGGSIRVHFRRGPSIDHDEPSVNWQAFAQRVEDEKNRVKALLDASGEQIVAYGATAKACTLIHHFGLQKRIAYCVDYTPEKQGLYIPGTAIKILPVETLTQSKSSKVIFLTAWNYASEIRAKHRDLEFVVPFEKEERLAA